MRLNIDVQRDNWLQAMYDLMASRHIKLEVYGEYGEVDATLKAGTTRDSMEVVGEVIGAETFEDAMAELIEQLAAAKEEATSE